MEEVNRLQRNISKGGAEIVVVSRTSRCGITKDSYDYVLRPMLLKSTVGAGDSMVGGMVCFGPK
jgi:fructose-1-phosphate kinase PfkB-like protein